MDNNGTIEIVIVGDEILQGDRADTNIAIIRETLIPIGLFPDRISVIGDDRRGLVNFFREAFTRAQVMIVTGGLGPTSDDNTTACLARAMGQGLVLDEESLKEIRAFFIERGRKMASSNEKQALIPNGASTIKNIWGTAPGIHAEMNRCQVFLLPGVPKEMKQMLEDYVLVQLKKKGKVKIPPPVRIRTTGIGESDLFEMLRDLDFVDELASLPTPRGVDIKITASKSPGGGFLSQAQIDYRVNKITKVLGGLVYTVGDRELEDIAAALLLEKGLTVATAESVTGGLVADLLTNVSGSSGYFRMGMITYSNESKTDQLGVNHDLIDSYGAVSAEVARAMAENIRTLAGTDIGLSTTGIAGPTGATTGKPVGVCYVGFSSLDTTFTRQFVFGKLRAQNKMRAAQTALNLLRLYLIDAVTL